MSELQNAFVKFVKKKILHISTYISTLNIVKYFKNNSNIAMYLKNSSVIHLILFQQNIPDPFFSNPTFLKGHLISGTF